MRKPVSILVNSVILALISKQTYTHCNAQERVILHDVFHPVVGDSTDLYGSLRYDDKFL